MSRDRALVQVPGAVACGEFFRALIELRRPADLVGFAADGQVRLVRAGILAA